MKNIDNSYIENLSSWYTNQQLDFDKVLINYRYKTINEFFRGKRCLEMGPADGVMTKMLRNDFEQLDLLEGSQNLLNLIPDYKNVNKFCSFFENYDTDKKYDTIIMEHILEHLISPYDVLVKVKEWLSDNGVLIVGVPNAKSFHRLAAVKMGLLKSEYELNERDRELGHFRIFDLNSLEKEVLDAGFNINQKGGVFFKPLSNKQIQDSWTEQMIEAFYLLGKDFQENAAEIFIVASKE